MAKCKNSSPTRKTSSNTCQKAELWILPRRHPANSVSMPFEPSEHGQVAVEVIEYCRNDPTVVAGFKEAK